MPDATSAPATAPALPFTTDEFRSRLDRTQLAMAEQNFDLLVITDPSNMNYLTGYDAWSFYVDQALLVPVDGAPVWVGREMDRPAAEATTWLGGDQLVAYDDSLVQAPDRHPMALVAEEVKRRGWGRRRLGLEMDSYFFSPRARDVLVSHLPDEAEPNDGSYVVRWLRAVKSPAELEQISTAARIVQAAMSTALELIEAGGRQAEVVAEIYRQLIRGEGPRGGQYTSTPPLVAVGRRSVAPHLTWTDGDFRTDEPTTIELVASRYRYHAPLARTVFVGKPPLDYRQAADNAVQVLNDTLDRMEAGITCDEVARIWHERANRVGLNKTSRLGYSFGISYPPTFGERTLSIRRGDFTILRENMTLHLIPGIRVGGWGLVISEPIVVTAEGAKVLCSVPRQVSVKDDMA